jgi:hypothetical protein
MSLFLSLFRQISLKVNRIRKCLFFPPSDRFHIFLETTFLLWNLVFVLEENECPTLGEAEKKLARIVGRKVRVSNTFTISG